MYYRRKILLNLIAAFGKQGVSKIKLQKLLFLLCRQQQQPAFDFVPHKYGCFSFQASKDLAILESHYQLIKLVDNTTWFSPETDHLLEEEDADKADELLARFGDYSENQITDFVYQKFPYFSINSKRKMTPRQLSLMKEQRQKVQRRKKTTLFTIGYEGKSIDAYLNALVKNNISLLCDVRKNPLSMKYGFSKRQLRESCKKLGINYEHIPELGIVSEKRRDLKDFSDYQKLFREYEKKLPQKDNELDRVMDLLKRYKRIALTCFELDHKSCHRHSISDYLQASHQLNCQHL